MPNPGGGIILTNGKNIVGSGILHLLGSIGDIPTDSVIYGVYGGISTPVSLLNLLNATKYPLTSRSGNNMMSFLGYVPPIVEPTTYNITVTIIASGNLSSEGGTVFLKENGARTVGYSVPEGSATVEIPINYVPSGTTYSIDILDVYGVLYMDNIVIEYAQWNYTGDPSGTNGLETDQFDVSMITNVYFYISDILL